MVAAQWVSLLANVALMLVLAHFIDGILQISTNVATISSVLGGSKKASVSAAGLLLVFVLAFLLRTLATTAGNRFSYLASTNVKRRLRELVYEKLMQLGTSYREVTATSEAVQISTEGVDQLEIYFGKYVPQFFYSMLAPLTRLIFTHHSSSAIPVMNMVLSTGSL